MMARFFEVPSFHSALKGSTVLACIVSLCCMATISLFMCIQLVWLPCCSDVDYPVRKGCSKYDFTVEQIEQKKEKKTRMVSVSVCLCLCSVREGRGCVRACVCVYMCMCLWGGDVCACVHMYVCVCVCVCAHAASDS